MRVEGVFVSPIRTMFHLKVHTAMIWPSTISSAYDHNEFGLCNILTGTDTKLQQVCEY